MIFLVQIVDSAYPLVEKVVLCAGDVKTAFTGANVCVLIGGFPRGKDMQRKDLMNKNAPIFIEQGKAINDFADRNVKVLVVANPANTNCWIAAEHAPSIPKKNFTALTRLDENRARAQLAAKLNVSVGEVAHAIIWGNHSQKQVPDAAQATVGGKSVMSVMDAATTTWATSTTKDEFRQVVQTRGSAVINMRNASSAFSAAKASADHLVCLTLHHFPFSFSFFFSFSSFSCSSFFFLLLFLSHTYTLGCCVIR